MTDRLPKFDAPPVVETVLSIQFDQLPGFTAALVGWFWKSYLSDIPGTWSKTAEIIRLEDQYEKFDEGALWAAQTFKVMMGQQHQRIQIIRSDEERMIQVQNSRLVLNWKKGEHAYPSYRVLLPEFNAVLVAFRRFAADAGYGNLQFNQWEVTYVNHLLKGDLWNTIEDLPLIFRNVAQPQALERTACESMNATWKYVIGENRGRLHADLMHVRTLPENHQAMRFELTARGPVQAGEADINPYFDLGHETILRSFTQMTTDKAHKAWKRTQ